MSVLVSIVIYSRSLMLNGDYVYEVQMMLMGFPEFLFTILLICPELVVMDLTCNCVMVSAFSCRLYNLCFFSREILSQAVGYEFGTRKLLSF